MTRQVWKLGSALLMGGVAAVPVTANSDPAPSELAAQALFTAPSGTLMLVREVHRALARGQELVTRRSYAVRFVRDGEGWLVEGDLIASEIDAPPELAALAQIEKGRRDQGLFPLRLNSQGIIIDQQGSSDPAANTQARAMVDGTLAKIPLRAGDQAVAAGMVNRIASQSAATGGTWPLDLFRPATANSTESRTVPLPDGSAGTVTVTINCERADDGLLASFQRQIVTELGGTRRESREIFRLARRR